jgi:hypothetical protein
VIEPTGSEAQARRNVLWLKIRKLENDLIRAQTCGKQLQNVDDSDTHSADARPPAALIRIHGNPLH